MNTHESMLIYLHLADAVFLQLKPCVKQVCWRIFPTALFFNQGMHADFATAPLTDYRIVWPQLTCTGTTKKLTWLAFLQYSPYWGALEPNTQSLQEMYINKWLGRLINEKRQIFYAEEFQILSVDSPSFKKVELNSHTLMKLDSFVEIGEEKRVTLG